MKKSMLTLVGCVLAAGSVMAAEVTGNNTAVVIKKDAVVSNNNYQFLIVPVKGFDITGNNGAQSLTLAEILPPSAYKEGTLVYSADNAQTLTYCRIMIVDGKETWVKDGSNPLVKMNDAPVEADTILWMNTTNLIVDVPATVFCGELSTTGATVTLSAGGFVAFGNAKSEDVNLSDIVIKIKNDDGSFKDGSFEDGDMIYAIKAGTSDYLIYYYDGEEWTKPNPNGGGMYIPAYTDDKPDKLPAGAAAYYYRKTVIK